MLVTEFRTLDLPIAERFASWHDMTVSALIPSAVHTDHEGDFQASARVLNLSGVQVSALTYPSLETRRTARMIRRSDPESMQLMLTLRGGHRILQGGQDTTIGSREMLLFDTSHPWHGWASADRDAVEGVLVQFPRALLPIPANKVKRLTGMRLCGREGVGALLSAYLTQLSTGAASYTTADSPRLATLTLDVLTAFLAHHLDATTSTPPQNRHRSLLMEIHAFIQQHLDDPDLSPGTIAAAHHISLRSLHRLFHNHAHGATVASCIRRQRLARARRDLGDPRLSTRPVHAIAARWGFLRPADFTRAFRTIYGSTPTEYRQGILRAGDGVPR